MTLKDLKDGDRVRIASVDPSDPGVQRLMTLGLVEGAELTFLHRSLGGDPLEFRLHGTSISLRQDQAKRFVVEHLQANEPRGNELRGNELRGNELRGNELRGNER